jgi:hypothetical protein
MAPAGCAGHDLLPFIAGADARAEKIPAEKDTESRTPPPAKQNVSLTAVSLAVAPFFSRGLGFARSL